MVKILLIGKNGQLGWELQRTCLPLGELIAMDYPEIDLSNTDELRDLIRTLKPDLVLNAAAYTNVDEAESEFELARKINAIAPAVIAEEIKKISGIFVHYSTDYVFDGKKGSSYVETDSPYPINSYGRTKLEGEQLVQGVDGASIIFRTSWVYSIRQGGFVSKVLDWARKQDILRIVDDQIGSPTWARMLAEATTQIVAQGRKDQIDYLREKSGLYHLAGSGFTSRFDWAKAIVEGDSKKDEQLVTQVLPAKSEEFPTAATRPENTSLDCSLFEQNFFLRLPSWRQALHYSLQ